MLIIGLAHINQEGLDEIKTIGFKIDRKKGEKVGGEIQIESQMEKKFVLKLRVLE